MPRPGPGPSVDDDFLYAYYIVENLQYSQRLYDYYSRSHGQDSYLFNRLITKETVNRP
jgi:hypothetical protein